MYHLLSAAELRYGGSERMGRKTCPSLDNLHISRDQLRLEVKLDRTGSTYVCMHNVSWVACDSGFPIDSMLAACAAGTSCCRLPSDSSAVWINYAKFARRTSTTHFIYFIAEWQEQHAHRERQTGKACPCLIDVAYKNSSRGRHRGALRSTRTLRFQACRVHACGRAAGTTDADGYVIQ